MYFLRPLILPHPRRLYPAHTPSIVLTALSSPNVSFTWTSPFNPVTNTSFSVPVASTSSPANTLVATYTLTAVDQGNKCKTTMLYNVYQNIFKPVAGIAQKPSTTLPA